MLYFVPAWYLEDSWGENEQFWYRRRMKSETDDTIKQLQLFQRHSICDCEILLLSFAPNFRHFLHRQSVFRVPYWSVFDAIQEVRRKKQAILSFHNLNWPPDIEFVYTMFSMIAMRNKERYANIEFGEYGNPIQIDLYKDGKLSRKNIYDDRGFVSCTSVYENGEKLYDQYLTEKGIWKLCHFTDGHVVVNPNSAQYLIHTSETDERIPFLKGAYPSMEEVIEEVLASMLRITKCTDIFCAAAHKRHLSLLGRQLTGRKTIYSVFEHRLALDRDRAAAEILSNGDYVVIDSEENLEIISRQSCFENAAKVKISPYDTRLEPGISQQLSVQKILLPVDHLSAKAMEAVIKSIAAYLERNNDARVHLFTRNAAFDRNDSLLTQIAEILDRNGYPPEWAGKVKPREPGYPDEQENPVDVMFRDAEEKRVPILFFVEQCVDVLSVNKCVREQRVLVDLEERPDLFLQILCLGTGIPQILREATEYMRPGKNGRINTDVSKLGEDLEYYLESLRHWNEASVQSFELGKKYTVQYLIDQWKEVIGSVENGTRIAAGGK